METASAKGRIAVPPEDETWGMRRGIRGTLRIDRPTGIVPAVTHEGQAVLLKKVDAMTQLLPGTWLQEKQAIVVCFDLPKGQVGVVV